jgi:chromate reductase
MHKMILIYILDNRINIKDVLNMKNVIVLIGGISKNSINKSLFNFFEEETKNKLQFNRIEIENLPFFSQDLENDPPEKIKLYQKQVNMSDAVLFITPEYNRSFPGVLKNAIDWCTRPSGVNLWYNKPAGIIGTSPSGIGTALAQNHLKQVINFLNMRLMNQPELYFVWPKILTDDTLPEQSKIFLKRYAESFYKWIE